MLKRSSPAAAALALLLSLTACATTPPSLYQRLGGRAAIKAVVEDAIGNISVDPRINKHFLHANAPGLGNNLVDLICERTGGPCVYRGLDMSASHEGMNIRNDEFDALVEDLFKSLAKFKVPEREQAEVRTTLERMRNAIVGH
ncbi:MAG: group 1 truncated hemoglobin [Burkholderiales bacterium]